ncbi:hypothetical protein [Pseudonocardia abyssalis]|uniref:Uncharacterized protein n=1 Tax=Pseudonocardia abyssalis TaxID=2792008 RepID=A0ABS6UYX7_9PSEU|nr:hypothetical protein [Pseudonocardia abyssalis]MBW0116014.1 hypothetical protein [Pseudonocardia abyssalis]MBW0137468.1 hypothetical protein [Pseudonocardia abyssalis]
MLYVEGIDAHVLPYVDSRHLGGPAALAAEIDRPPVGRAADLDPLLPDLDERMRARRRASDRRGACLGACAALVIVAYLVLAIPLTG